MRILLVEDDVMLGKATLEGLKTSYVVDWCTSAEDAEAAIDVTHYDLLILDINLPGKSGIDLLKNLRTKNDNRPALFLTARDAVSHRIDGLNAGGDDYLVKPFDLDELIARIGALIRRSQGQASSKISCGNIVYDSIAKRVKNQGKFINLSRRELDILETLISNIDRVMSKTQIEEHIYDWDSGNIESNTIEVHISGLRRKLGKDLIKTIRGVGYMIPS